MASREEAKRRREQDAELKYIRDSGQVPPNDMDAEAAVLSACLLTQEAFDQVVDLLKTEHFYSDANGYIWSAVVDLFQENQTVDLVTVARLLKDRGRLDQVGGTPYLHQIANATPSVANVRAHAQIVVERSRLRRAIKASRIFLVDASEKCEDVQALLDSYEHQIFEIGQSVVKAADVEHISEIEKRSMKTMMAARARGGAVSGTPTGFIELDKMLSGLHGGDLTIIAGRPGMGKTSLVMNACTNIAFGTEADPENGIVETLSKAVAIFSLEMPKEQLVTRMLASEARVDMKSIRNGKIHNEDWPKLTTASAALHNLPIWIDATPGLNLAQLRARLRRVAAAARRGEKGASVELGAVAIDYIQLMQGLTYKNSREQEVSEISRGLKAIAKEFGIPVLALSQLNRSVEMVKDKRPQLSALRESGAIEQDADNILFIYRDEYYRRDSPDKGVAEVIVAKQRNGPTGVVRTKFTAEFTRFDNLADAGYDFDEYDSHAAEDYGNKVSP